MSMDEQDLSYALAKQVPDMRGRGFIIGTSYGEIDVPPGPLAERLADHVRLVLALELALIRAEQDKPLQDERPRDGGANSLARQAQGAQQ